MSTWVCPPPPGETRRGIPDAHFSFMTSDTCIVQYLSLTLNLGTPTFWGSGTLRNESLQVDYKDLEGRTFLAVPGHTLRATYEFGTMTQFAYRLEGGEEEEELVVATTRLETMLGDTVRRSRDSHRPPKSATSIRWMEVLP